MAPESKPFSDLVSVVIPAYNHQAYIEQTIRSLIAQSYPTLELIVIDDGSKDNSWDILQKLKPECEARFARVDFIRQENQGIVATCNRLIREARGDYVYLIASDDLAKPQAIETLHGFLSAHADYGLAVGDNELIDSDGRRIYWGRKKKVIYPEEISPASGTIYKTFGAFLQNRREDMHFLTDDFGDYGTLLRGNYIPNGYLIRKTVLDAVGGYDLHAPLEDWYLMMQIAKIARIKYLDEILFSYRWHDDNTAKKTDRMSKASRDTFRYEMANIYRNSHPDNILRLERFLKTNGKRVFVNLGPVFKVTKYRNLSYSEYVVTAFGKAFSKKIYK